MYCCTPKALYNHEGGLSSTTTSAYADDVIVMINNQNDVQILLKLLEDFKVLSSAKVNWNKSEALVCGKWASGRLRLPEGLRWNTEGFKYLGVFWEMSSLYRKTGMGLLKNLKVV